FAAALTDPEGAPIELRLEFRMTRGSDKQLMMVSSTQKTIWGTTLADTGLINYNDTTCHAALYVGANSVHETLRTELALTAGDFAHVPVLFQSAGGGGGALAYTPNMVNCQVFNGTLLVPRPFGPRNAAGDDVLEQDLLNQVGAGVVFVDDWLWYHIWEGESHCGTNARRAPSDVNWWEDWE
ncbi:MAG: protein-arginine deiminase family protein, partial [Armatimonadota bacterium]